MPHFFQDTSDPGILESLKKPSARVVIFGSGVTGKAVLEAANRHGISVSAFCDNNPRLQGSGFGGVEILSPEEARARFPGALFFIAVPRLFSVVPQLKSLGLAGRCLTIDILRESVTPGLPSLPGYIAATIDGTAYEQKAIGADGAVGSHLSLLTLVVTDHCTLRCRHCSHRIPYISRPHHRDAAALRKTMDAFLPCIDGIHTLSLASGDSLTYPNLPALARDFLRYDKIHAISIWTNAIIPLDKEEWRGFDGDRLSFHVTDYHHPRQKLPDFIAAAAEVGLKTYVSQREWTDIRVGGPPASPEETRRRFQLCQLSMCITINDDKLYRCTMIPNATAEGLMPDDGENHVDLSRATDPASLRREIHGFLFNKTSMPACAYCSGGRPGDFGTVAPADQM